MITLNKIRVLKFTLKHNYKFVENNGKIVATI